jgi:hypothetical protein
MKGYTRSDVEDLNTTVDANKQNEPLVPSIEKRYLMVLDRSNVVRPGDRPKVLLFKELPVR